MFCKIHEPTVATFPTAAPMLALGQYIKLNCIHLFTCNRKNLHSNMTLKLIRRISLLTCSGDGNSENGNVFPVVGLSFTANGELCKTGKIFNLR